MRPRDILIAFDDYLDARALHLEAIVIGGAALNLLGLVSRPTKDCDILDPALPATIVVAARAFAAEVRTNGEVLDDDWLNNGPASLADVLPDGWKMRVQRVFTGRALTLSALGRTDLLRSKVFALCDRGIDLGDCMALAPTAGELRELLPWLENQDANTGWPEHARSTVRDLGRRLGHGL